MTVYDTEAGLSGRRPFVSIHPEAGLRTGWRSTPRVERGRPVLPTTL
jgi:hypothetical protein